MPHLETIEAIVFERIRSEPQRIQAISTELLERWKRITEPGHPFCRVEAVPAIAALPPKFRSRALNVLRDIKSAMAEVLADEMILENQQRISADRMKQETLHAYEVIRRQGRGVVYFGSARTKPGDADYEAGRELGREVAHLLGVTSWSGAGPGAMEAPLRGAKEAGGRVGGIKIAIEAAANHFEQEISDVFQPEEVGVCKFFGPRKVGLVDAGMMDMPGDKRAFIYLPGGFGTLDEFFEVLTLKQLRKLGSADPRVPVLLMNYNGYYNGLLEYFRASMLRERKINESDLSHFTVCETNRHALDALADRFDLPLEKRSYAERLTPWETWYPSGADQAPGRIAKMSGVV